MEIENFIKVHSDTVEFDGNSHIEQGTLTRTFSARIDVEVTEIALSRTPKTSRGRAPPGTPDEAETRSVVSPYTFCLYVELVVSERRGEASVGKG